MKIGRNYWYGKTVDSKTLWTKLKNLNMISMTNIISFGIAMFYVRIHLKILQDWTHI